MNIKHILKLNPVLNLFQRFRKPTKRIYRFNAMFSSNTFLAPTIRQLNRLKTEINPQNSYFKNIDTLCKKTKASIVLDIGTNIGYWAYAFSQSSDKEREIIGFEPDLRNLSIAAHNLLNIPGINLFHLGLSDSCGRFKVAIPSEGRQRKKEERYNTGLMTAFDNENSLGTRFVICDQFLKVINTSPESIACIKIDVEGFEEKVLIGLNETLKKTSAFLIVEVNPITMRKSLLNFNKLVKNLEELNYISLIDPKLNIKIENGFTNRPFNMISVKNHMADYTCKLMGLLKYNYD